MNFARVGVAFAASVLAIMTATPALAKPLSPNDRDYTMHVYDMVNVDHDLLSTEIGLWTDWYSADSAPDPAQLDDLTTQTRTLYDQAGTLEQEGLKGVGIGPLSADRALRAALAEQLHALSAMQSADPATHHANTTGIPGKYELDQAQMQYSAAANNVNTLLAAS